MVELCEAALADHLSRCGTCAWPNCGFDVTKCHAGGSHNQVIACLAPLILDSYTLTASCSAINNEVRNPDGSFGFLEQPMNDTMNDPPLCRPSSNLELDPPRGLGQYKGSETDGTFARVTWSMADMSGQEQRDELEVSFQYAIMPCEGSSADCLELTALELAQPTTTALGMTITKARLSVTSIAEAPVIEHGDSFRFSEGAIGVLMQAYVEGIPLVLSGTNVGSPTGRLSPAGDQFSISGLRFEFEDSIITAALEIEIQGQYDARRPNAQITRLSAPESCDDPVSFLSTSWDDDLDALTHTWWIRGVGSFDGALLELPLPPGEHDLMLTVGDPSGLFDSQVLRYSRTCQ